MTYHSGLISAEDFIVERFDRKRSKRPDKLKCRPGYEQRGAVCHPITKKQEDEPSGVKGGSPSPATMAQSASLSQQGENKGSKKSPGGAIVGGTIGLALTAAIAAPPVIMVNDVKKNLSPKKDEEPPRASSIKRADLDEMYDDFKPGDIIQRSFELGGGARAWHYAVYTGRNKETGEHEVIDVHTAKKDEGKEGKERFYVGKRSAMPQDGDSPKNSIYRKLPDDKLSKDRIKDRKEILARAEEFSKMEEWDYRLGTNNCEVFARAVVENNPFSYDGASVSAFTQQMGKLTIDQYTYNKINDKKGMQIPELQARLQKTSREYKRQMIEELYNKEFGGGKEKKKRKKDSLLSRLDAEESSWDKGYMEMFIKEPEYTEAFKSGDKSKITVKDLTKALGVVTPSEYQLIVQKITSGQPETYQKYLRASMMQEYLTLLLGTSTMLTENSKKEEA